MKQAWQASIASRWACWKGSGGLKMLLNEACQEGSRIPAPAFRRALICAISASLAAAKFRQEAANVFQRLC